MGWIIESRLRAEYWQSEPDEQWMQVTAGIGRAPLTLDVATELLRSVEAIQTFEYRAVLVTDTGERIPEVHYTKACNETRLRF